MVLKSPSFYEFGPFRLEPSEHRLTRDGQQVSLSPKNFELLVYLVEHHGQLIFKDQIMQAVWRGSFVEEANLTVAISVLRKLLGKTESGLQYIETVPKKGYRFVASVKKGTSMEAVDIEKRQIEPSNPTELLLFEPQRSSAIAPALPPTGHDYPVNGIQAPLLALPKSSRLKSWRWLALLAIILVACLAAATVYILSRKAKMETKPRVTQRSLAILPLQNLRRDSDIDYLGFSLSDAVITKLSAVSSLTVRPSSAVEKYKGQTIDLPKIAADLNVDTLLTGNFIRDGDQLRITYQLIDVKTDQILGEDTIDLKFDKLLAVQDSVAQEIIKGLQLDLTPSEAELIKSDEPIQPLAYEYYLRGVDLVGSHNYLLAIKVLEKSVTIDPNHALTWAYLGQSYNSAAAFKFGGREQYRKAEGAYERALALRPTQLETRMFFANLLIDTGKVERAVPMLRDELKNNPKPAGVHWELGYAYRFGGMLQDSVAECELAQRIEPSVKSNGSVLNAYLYLGEYDKFLRSLPDESDSLVAFYRGFGEFHQGDRSRAAQDFKRAYQLDATLYTEIGIALSDSIAKRDADGLEILRKLENIIRDRGVGDPEGAYKVAQSFAVLNDKPSALRMLRYSIENGFFAYPYFIRDPLLVNVKREAEFPELMEIARRRHEAFKSKFF
jgi:DNA-binding winged helix-turn-helix (wHTH) protein/TolB-like protein